MTYENLSKTELLHELKKLSLIDDCYQSSVESAPLGIIVHSPIGQTRVFNAQLVKITGYTKAEIPDIQLWRDLIHSGVKTQQQWEGTITRKDGGKRSCLFSSIVSSTGFQTIFVTDISEQKQVRATLMESEERYCSLFNILPYGGEIIDTKGKILNCSSSTALMLGYTESEIIGKHITEFLDPDSFQIFHQNMPTLLSGKFASAEICMVHKDGTLLNIKRAANPILNKNGNVEAILAINVDITNVKKSEEALRIERDNLNSIFEAMKDGVFIGSQQFDIQYMNPVLIKEFGPYEGRKCYEYFNDRNDPCPWCLNSKVFAGETVRWEWTSPKNHKTYDLIDTPIINPDGSISKLEIIRDISEHKEATKKLRESEERYRSIFDNNQSVMLLIDPETARIVDANPAAVAYYGWSHNELIRKKISDINLLSKEDVFKEIERASQNEKECFLFSHRLASGEVRDVEVYSNTIIVDEELLLFSVIHDVTDRKHAENILLKTSRMEATATLAAGVAHDFNNLMVGVLGYSELLKNRYETDSPASEMLDTIGDCARKAGDLAQQLLAYARGGKYLPKIMNLNETIQDTLRLNERSFPPRIRIERDYEPELMNVFADAVQMSQVVTNLCINSVEAIESNGRIIITTRNVILDEKFTSFHPTLQPGQYVYLSVEDTGNGMDNETLGKIFEPFFSTKFQGRGLGLAAVYGIVKNHDGYISAYSEVGMGATFKIYLPAAVGLSIPERRPQQMDLSGNETILIIDDEKMVLDVTRRMLELSGYHVLLAHDGQDAVEVAKNYEGEIHLAVLDMSMPILGGPEAFPLLKEARPDMRIIICSGFELDAAAQSLLDAGAETFIQKPFRREDLIQAVRAVFDK